MVLVLLLLKRKLVCLLGIVPSVCREQCHWQQGSDGQGQVEALLWHPPFGDTLKQGVKEREERLTYCLLQSFFIDEKKRSH